jgi:rRNA-processing protein FCF1
MEILIISLLLVIAAEATYLVAVNTKKSVGKKAGRPIFVDTSVLIDGRIIAVAESGFIGSDTLFIPRSVIGELQYLADNADAEKRSRARHGLDIVSELQKMPLVKVEIFQDGSKAEEGVDERLLKLAKQYKGAVCTIDYNLNKVAQVENIQVLNVNDLAMSLRMAYLPGERMLLELTQKGNDGSQAVGHLTDGTMVVVEKAFKLIGKTVEIEFIRSLQTAAGKMMFAKLVDQQKPQTPFVKKDRPQRPSKQSQHIAQAVQTAAMSAPEGHVAPAALAFHSDRNDQRLATKAAPKRSQAAPRPPRVQQPKQQQARANQVSQPRQTKKPRTSSQREADLINLLNNQ